MRRSRHRSTPTRRVGATAALACLLVLLGLLAIPPSAGAAGPALAAAAPARRADPPQPVTLQATTPATGGAFVALTTRTPPVQTTATATPTFTTDDATICRPVNGNHQVEFLTAGLCTITVAVAGNTGFSSGAHTLAYTVEHATRTLAVAAPTATLVALGHWDPVVTGAGADLDDVVLSTADDDVCEAVGTRIELHQARACTVTATLAQGAVYALATADRSVTPDLAQQTVTLAAPASNVAGVPWTTTVTSSRTGVTPTFEITDSDVCRPTAGTTTIQLLVQGGTCAVRAKVAGDGVVYADGTSNQVSFAVQPRTVGLQVEVSEPRRYGQDVTITVTATDSDPATAPATSVSGSGTILVGNEVATPGTTGPEDVVWTGGVAKRTVRAPRAGTLAVHVVLDPTPATSYERVTANPTVEVGMATQTVAFGTPPDRWVGTVWPSSAVLNPATDLDGSARTAQVVSDTTGVCTVTPGTATVKLVGAGLCKLRASHPGDANYQATTTEAKTEFQVDKRPVEIVYTVTPTVVPGTSPVHLDDVTITAKAVDGVDHTTPIAGTGTLSVTHVVTPAAPTPRGTTDGTTGGTIGGTSADAPGLEPAPRADPPPTPWTSSTTLEVLGGHTYTGQVSFAAQDATTYATYVTGTQKVTFDVQKVLRNLAWSTTSPPPTAVDAGDRWAPVVTREPADATVVLGTVDSPSGSVCRVEGTEIVFVGAGACRVTATQAGDENHLTTTISTDVQVRLRKVTVQVGLSKASPVFGDTVTVTATVKDDRDAARLLGGTGTLTAPGLLPAGGVPLTFTSGSATYDLQDLPVVDPAKTLTATFVPATADARVYETDQGATSLRVGKAPQTIVPPTDLDTAVSVGDDVAVLATVQAAHGGSGAPVTGSVVAGASCSVVNPTVAGQPVVVTFNRAQPCRVLLDLAGGSNHTAAAQQHVDFTVARRKVMVKVTTSPDPVYWNDLVEVTVAVTETTGSHAAVPGTVTVGVPGITGVETVATSTAGGSTTIRYRVKVAGTQTLAVTFVPSNTTKYDAISVGDAAATQTFLALARPQTVTFDATSIPDPAYVSKTWTVPVTGSGSGTVVVVPQTGAPVHCTVTGLVVTFSSAGDCRLEAYQEEIAGQWAESAHVPIVVPVSKIPYKLTITQPESGAVSSPLIVRATARDTPFLTTIAGTGTLSLERLVGGAWVRVVPDPATTPVLTPVAWSGGTRTLSVVPTRAGTYRAVATFTPDSTVTYDRTAVVVTPTATFQVASGSQQVAFVDAPTTASVLDSWAVTTTADAAPRRAVVSVAATSDPGACAVSGPAGTQVVTFTAIGSCVLDLMRPGDDDYAPVHAPPVTVVVGRATTAVGVVGQTVAQPVVGAEHLISVAATSTTSAVRVRGRFVLTLPDGSTQAVPAAALGAGVPGVLSADFSIFPTTKGAYDATVTFEPADQVGVAGSTADLRLQVLPGTQRLSVALSPSSSKSYVGDEWDTLARVEVGPAGAVPHVESTDTAVCDVVTGTTVVELRAAGRCTVTFTAPATPGGNWNAATPVVRAFDVAIKATSFDLAVIVPAARPEAWVDEEVTVRAAAFGVDTGSTLTPIDGKVTFVLTKIQGDASLPATRSETVTVGPDGLAVWPLSVPGESIYGVSATLKPDQSAQWAETTVTTDDLSVERRPQTLTKPTLPAQSALTTWTSTVRSSGGLLAEVASRTPVVCTASARVVTLLTPGTCGLTFSTADDRVYLAADPVDSTIEVGSNPTSLTLTPPATGAVGATLPLAAVVSAPLPAPDPLSGAVVTPGPHGVAGTVQFWATEAGSDAALVDAVPVTVVAGTPLPVAGSWTPGRSTVTVAQSVHAVFVPTADSSPTAPRPVWTGASAPAVPVAVARGEARLALTITHGASDPADQVTLEATITFPGRIDPDVVGGTVLFASDLYRLFPDTPVPTAVEVVDGPGGPRATARLVTSAVLARAAVDMTATYSGTPDILGVQTETRRDVPVVTRSGAAAPTGWQRSPVTFRYTCTPTTGALLEPCPTAVTLADDGVARRRTFAVVADDGGTTTVTTPSVDIDTTRPTLRVEGVRQGAVYNGLAPGARCRASDATSGVASCVLSTTRVDRETRRVTARAVDEAGNVSTLTVTYRELQEWVVGVDRDAQDRFEVTPGKRIRVETITEGARRKPQIVVRRPGGSWKAVTTMVASRQRDGDYTWYGFYALPKTWRPSTQVGVRVGSKVTVLGLVKR